MDEDELRDLLESVKAGDLSPEEAADRLRDARRSESEERTRPIETDPPVVNHDEDVRKVRIRAVADRAFVKGDPSVRSVRVEGHHRMRDEDGVLIIESDFGDFDDLADDLRFGFRLRSRRGGFGPAFKLHRLSERGTLRVTVNPSIPVDIECDAGNVDVRDLPGPLTVRVNAGNAKVTGIDGPLVGIVNAGNLRARGRLRGESSLDCSVGKIDLELDDDSPLRITKTVSLGSVDVDSEISGSGPDVLEVTCNLGSVRVRSSAFSSTR